VLHAAQSDVTAVPELLARLASVDPRSIATDAGRIAFWVNLYNALVRHSLAGKQGSLLRHLAVFGQAELVVGGLGYTANVIEHGLLRLNRRPPMALRRTLRGTDPRLAAAPSVLDPRVHFALNCGAVSCPPIRSYTEADLEAQLDLATRSYLDGELRWDPQRGVLTLPYLCKLYRSDFGDLVRFAARYLPNLDERATPRLSFGKYSWTIAL
jgi:hypothetical protein